MDIGVFGCLDRLNTFAIFQFNENPQRYYILNIFLKSLDNYSLLYLSSSVAFSLHLIGNDL